MIPIVCCFLSQADDTRALLQFRTKLYIVDLAPLSREFFYQQVRCMASFWHITLALFARDLCMQFHLFVQPISVPFSFADPVLCSRLCQCKLPDLIRVLKIMAYSVLCVPFCFQILCQFEAVQCVLELDPAPDVRELMAMALALEQAKGAWEVCILFAHVCLVFEVALQQGCKD